MSLPAGADGTPAKDDFVEGALNDCGVGVIVWGTAFAYKNDAFDGKTPETINDFFDTKIISPVPAPSAMIPTVIMEWALMADGVAREDVYPMLETEEGVERAFEKMDVDPCGPSDLAVGPRTRADA